MAGDLTIGVKLVADSSGVVRGMRLTEAELERLAQRIRRASDDTTRINSSFNLLHGTLNKLAGVLAGAFAVHTIAEFAKSAVEAQIQLQKIEFTLQAVTGSAAAAHKEFEFVADLSNKLGLSLTDMASGYARLSASALGAGESLDSLHRGFAGLSEAFSVLHLSGEETNRILVQIEQGFSLGRIQMIDLRALAQSLPGTFELAAKAVEGTGKSLEQMLKQGGIPAKLFFEQLTRELHEKYGPTAVETSHALQASLVRLKNSFFNLKADVASDNFADNLSASVGELSDALNDPAMRASIKSLMGLLSDLGAAAVTAFASAAHALGALNPDAFVAQARIAAKEPEPNNPQYLALLDQKLAMEDKVKDIESRISNFPMFGDRDLKIQLLEELDQDKKWLTSLKVALESVEKMLPTLTVKASGIPDVDPAKVKAADKLRQSFVTPEEKFRQTLSQYYDLYKGNYIHQDEYYKAVRQAQLKFYKPQMDAAKKAQKALQDRVIKDQLDFEIGGKPQPLLDSAGMVPALPKLKDIGQLQSQYEKLTKTSNDFADSLKKSLDPMQALQDAAGQMTSQFINGLTDAILSGQSFGKVLENITKQIGEMIIKLTIEFAIREAMQALLFAANGKAFGAGGNVLPFAKGGAFDSGGVKKFASGGIVTSPTPFRYAGGLGVMGEAGPEAVMPLKQMRSGKLGVHAEMAPPIVQIIDNRGAGAPPVKVEQSRGQDGRTVIRATIEAEVKRMADNGTLDSTLAANYGVKRRGRF